jgi:dTMP kinase
MDSLSTPHPFPGKLIIVEGIDGSGKSTQLQLAMRHLKTRGYPVFFTEWNSADLVKAVTKKGKKKMTLTPMTFSLLHATDFAHRLINNILPPLKAGMVVLADRYVYTAFARDVVRGCDPSWVRRVYNFAPRPDLALYFNVPIDVSCSRILSGRAQLKDYEAGMDLKLAPDKESSFKIFQSRILTEYERIKHEYGLLEVDATQSIGEQQQLVRRLVDRALADYHPDETVPFHPDFDSGGSGGINDRAGAVAYAAEDDDEDDRSDQDDDDHL